MNSAFLDNRLGCYVLCALATRADLFGGEFRVVLGATASEEMGGFGARVLAAAVRPDLVVCLDATYEAPEQGVLLGQGPVLTLSDASVLLSCRRRDQVCRFFAGAGVALQTEVYNYSGTDARAFPRQGLPAPVLPLLVATRGNHSPVETAALDDVRQTVRAVAAVAGSGVMGGMLAAGFNV
jgi:endoglucanase